MCSCFISSTRFLQTDYKFFEGRELLIYTSWSSYSIYHIGLNIPGCQYNYLNFHIPVFWYNHLTCKKYRQIWHTPEIFRAFLDHTCCFLPLTHPRPQPLSLASSCFTFFIALNILWDNLSFSLSFSLTLSFLF